MTQNHVKALFNLDRLNKESARELRKLINDTSIHMRALGSLGETTQNCDTLIIYLLTTKLDPISLREWEQQKNSLSKPTLENLTTFLRNRVDIRAYGIWMGCIGSNKQSNLKRQNQMQFYKENRFRKIYHALLGNRRNTN